MGGSRGVSRLRRVRCGADLLPSRLLPSRLLPFSSVASSSKFSLRAPPNWRDLPVTHTGFSGPPPFRLLY